MDKLLKELIEKNGCKDLNEVKEKFKKMSDNDLKKFYDDNFFTIDPDTGIRMQYSSNVLICDLVKKEQSRRRGEKE